MTKQKFAAKFHDATGCVFNALEVYPDDSKYLYLNWFELNQEETDEYIPKMTNSIYSQTHLEIAIDLAKIKESLYYKYKPC